jgi:chorismatase
MDYANLISGGHPQALPEDRPLMNSRVLGMVNFGPVFQKPVLEEGSPFLSLRMTSADEKGFVEQWTAGPAQASVSGDLVYAHDGEYLFCAAEIPASERCRNLTRETYLAAFELMDELGYPRLFRMWNYIPRINEDNADGLEIYRDFCAGRSEAFELYGRRRHLPMPAATGIGAQGGNIAFFFLSCRSGRVTFLENPRQMPAYTYPRQYGPRSPSFARATCVQHDALGVLNLYISGTASIIGHETVHRSDLMRQCDVTLENISLLIGRDNLIRHGIETPADLTLRDVDFIKVYVRHAEDIPAVRRRCREAFAPHANIQFLNVDICRSDLLVEIEGIITVPLRADGTQDGAGLKPRWLVHEETSDQ